jgi:hypothetical protein
MRTGARSADGAAVQRLPPTVPRFLIWTEPISAAASAITSAYDGVGNKLTNTYPGGRVITAAYDALHRKRQLTAGASLLASNAFIGPYRLERRLFGNGVQTDWGYDSARLATNAVKTLCVLCSSLPTPIKTSTG